MEALNALGKCLELSIVMRHKGEKGKVDGGFGIQTSRQAE